MKKFFYDKRIVFMYLITIVFLVIGTTYALSSNSMALGLTTAIVKVDEEAYGSTTFDTSELDFIPILDSEVETNQENVIHIDFKVGGSDENNNDNIIYDIALNDLNVNCDLLSPYIKWKLVKNGEEISNGSLDYKFDTIDENGRLVLTSIQQDLVDYSDDKSVYDDYNFYMWFSDSCQGDLLSCMNSGVVDQSNLLGQNLSGKIEVELYTESKKELVRKPETTLTNSKCDGKYFATLETDGGVINPNTIPVVNGQPFGELPTPTRTDVITFDTNGGGEVVFVNDNLEEEKTSSLDKKYFDYSKEKNIIPKIKFLEDATNTKSVTYTFEGWYLDQAFTKPVTSATRVDTSKNIKLYAKWSGDNQITLPESNRLGYDFLGWYHDITLNNKAGNGGDSYIVDGSKTLFAKWESNAYMVTYNSGNLLYGLNDISNGTTYNATYTISNKTVTINATAHDGYVYTTGRFYLEAGREYIFRATADAVWGVEGADTVSAYFMKDGVYDASIPYVTVSNTSMNENGYYVFSMETSGTYHLRLDANLSGTTHTFSDISVSYNIGSSEVFYGQYYGEMPTAINTGNTFNGWYTDMFGGSQVTNNTLVSSVEEHTLYANWTPNNYNLNYYNNLVANGHFIDAANGWTLSNYAHKEVLSNTTNTIRVTSTGTGAEGFTTSYRLNYKPNTKYRISLKAYRNSSSIYGDLTKDFRVYLQERDANDTLIGYNHHISINSSNLPNTTWKEFSAEFTTTSSGTSFYYLQLDYYGVSGTSTIWVTDVKVEEIQTETKSFGSFLGTLVTPVRTGYTFGGWFTGDDGTGTQLTDKTLMPANDYNVYAKWTASNNTLTVNPNGGSFNGTTGVSTFTQGSNSILLIPKPTRTGYNFAGWTISGNGILHKYGTGLFNDEYFSSGTNSMGVYNNAGGGTVTHTRVAKSSDNPIKNATYMMQIQTAGTASPGLGGFVQYTTSKASGVFYHVIVAKIPVGYHIYQANNAVGTNGSFTWLTPQAGTGKFETYIYRANNGSSGTFSSFGHVYINGTAATSSSPVVWYVAYANMFDATNGTTDSTVSQIFDYNKGGSTTITANWSTNGYYFDVNPSSGISSFSISGGVNSGSGLTDYYYENDYGTQFTITSVAAKTGYTYTGYTLGGSATAVSGSTNSTIKVQLGAGAGSIALNSKANTYTVTLNNQSATTAGSTSVTATYNSAMPSATMPKRAYTVTYNANGGSVSPTSATATYTFGGYYTGTNGSGTQYYTAAGASARSWNLTAATTLYAKWTSASVTLPTPTRSGYTFLGWYTAASGGTKVGNGGASYTPTSTLTIYAQWRANNYKISAGSATYADTLANAISWANAGATITLQKNLTDTSTVAFSKNLTFNFGTYHLTRSATITINSGVSVTFSGTGGVVSTSNVTLTNNGTFTLNGATILNAAGSSESNTYRAIVMSASSGKVYLNTGKVYSRYGTGVVIQEDDSDRKALYVGSSSGSYSKTAIIVYGSKYAIYCDGVPKKQTVIWRNGSMYSKSSKWVTANINEDPDRGSCGFNAYSTAPSKSYDPPDVTIGSHSATPSTAYMIWLTKTNGGSAACAS